MDRVKDFKLLHSKVAVIALVTDCNLFHVAVKEGPNLFHGAER